MSGGGRNTSDAISFVDLLIEGGRDGVIEIDKMTALARIAVHGTPLLVLDAVEKQHPSELRTSLINELVAQHLGQEPDDWERMIKRFDLDVSVPKVAALGNR